MQNLITRRQALRQTFFYSAALALAGRLPLAEAQGVTPGDLHFLMLGDFGSLGQQRTLQSQPPATPAPGAWVPQQGTVAAAMESYVRAQGIRPEGLFLLGDNFYGPFAGGVNCPRWRTGFEDMYPASVFPGPCWAMLGNHDYDEEAGLKLAAELDYAGAHPGTRWTMPAKWYRLEWPAKHPLLTCLVLDSNYKNMYLYLTPEEKAKQLGWLRAELAKPRTTPWLVCMAHHPVYSNGIHGDNQPLIKDWAPLFHQYNVPFYFAGHDHDLQHLEFEGTPTSYVISGGGGAHLTPIRIPERSLFSQSVYGFTHLQVSREHFIVRHLDAHGKQLHGFSKSSAGQMSLLS